MTAKGRFWKWVFIFTGLLLLISPGNARAFQYQSLPVGNLIHNPWFRSDGCKFSNTGWNMDDIGLGSQASWGGSDKFQDPNDINCDGNWTGFAARFARNAGQANEFYPNKDAIMSQVVGPVGTDNTTLNFHFLFVAHRFNQLKVEIYGGDSVSGPWISVWVPFNKENCLTKDCANAPFNQYCMADRTCLWDYVTAAYLGSATQPLSKTISSGYPYYKVAFLMNYPEPDNSSTGDVGGKIARVFFNVSGGTPSSMATQTPAAPGSLPTLAPIKSLIPGSSGDAGNAALSTLNPIAQAIAMGLFATLVLVGTIYFMSKENPKKRARAGTVLLTSLVSLLGLLVFYALLN